MNLETKRLLGKLQAGQVIMAQDWAVIFADPGLTRSALPFALKKYATQACLERGVKYVEADVRIGVLPLLSSNEPVAEVEVLDCGGGHIMVVAVIRRPTLPSIRVQPGIFS